MTEIKKTLTSISSSNSLKTEVCSKEIYPPNAIPYKGSLRPQRHLYAGMLFPSRIVDNSAAQSAERESK